MILKIVGLVRAWRFSRLRKLVICQRCAACGMTADADSRRLMRLGFYRAAVFAARLELEIAMCVAVDQVEAAGGPEYARQVRSCNRMIPYLRDSGRITKRQAHKIRMTYDRASRLVHGAVGPKGRCREICAASWNAVGFLRDEWRSSPAAAPQPELSECRALVAIA